MKIFLTGATGFIGINLVNKLVESNCEIVVNLHSAQDSPFSAQVGVYRLGEDCVENDIYFLKSGGFDGCIHLASLYLTSHQPEDVNHLIDSNIKFGSYVLECSVKAKIKWFLNTGTFWQNFENAIYSPVNLYAATKQAFQVIAEYYVQTNQITFVTLKLCDTFGPNDPRPKVFNIWFNYAKQGKVLAMSEGDQLIDVLYISDVVDAYFLLANQLLLNSKKVSSGDEFALKASKRYTLKQLSELFEEVTNLELKIKWGGRPYRDREVMIPWENGILLPDWQPKVSIEEGIRLCFN
jgi:CDP-paratose synthetase